MDFKPYPCDLCPSRFASRQNRMVHIKTSHKKIRWHCQQCLSFFVHKQSIIKNHQMACWLKIFKCHLCEEAKKGLRTFPSFAEHYVTHPRADRKLSLDDVEKIYLEKRSQSGNFTCNSCQKVFASKVNLKKHKENSKTCKNMDKSVKEAAVSQEAVNQEAVSEESVSEESVNEEAVDVAADDEIRHTLAEYADVDSESVVESETESEDSQDDASEQSAQLSDDVLVYLHKNP